MTRKTYWGIAALIIFVIAAGGFMYWQWSQVQQLKEQLAQDEKLLEEKNKPKVQHAAATSDTKPPDEPGFEWVRHGDHWDKVPIAQAAAQTPDSDEIVLKSDLPDELPENFPTDAELQKMHTMDILHLIRVYKAEIKTLRKTDYDASVKLSQAIMPKLGARMLELNEEANALMEERNRESMAQPRFYPATEESPAMILEVIPPPDYESEESEGGNK